MKVTEVRVSPAKGGKVRAFASVEHFITRLTLFQYMCDTQIDISLLMIMIRPSGNRVLIPIHWNPQVSIRAINSLLKRKKMDCIQLMILKGGRFADFLFMESISCGNYRSLMRNLLLVLPYFSYTLKSLPYMDGINKNDQGKRLLELRSRSYYVLRTFIIGKPELDNYRVPFSYQLKGAKGNSIEFVKMGAKFIIPPVHNFVYIIPSKLKDRQYRGFFKIRLLQFLTKCENPRSIKYLCSFFEKHFGYNKEMNKYDI